MDVKIYRTLDLLSIIVLVNGNLIGRGIRCIKRKIAIF